MKSILLCLVVLGLSACSREGTTKQVEGAVDNFKVEFLFETEGCKVYRFIDAGTHYFTNCTETITTKSCGKNCRKQENIKGQ